MKIEETYILNYDVYSEIKWLSDEIWRREHWVNTPFKVSSIPVFNFVKVIKCFDNKWFIELPTYNFGTSITLPTRLIPIKRKLTQKLIHQLFA